MSESVRYVCVARLNGDERVFLWEGEDPGPARVIVDEQGFVLSFSSPAVAREFAQTNGWKVASNKEPTAYDIDGLVQWCRSDAGVHGCIDLLNAWNLLSDMPETENMFRAADARARDLYDKLFRSCNLPSVTLPGEHYEPVWTASEIATLKQLLLLGAAEFRARFRQEPDA